MDIDTLVKFKSCCFCLSLRTGCILIALLHVAFGALFFLMELMNAIMIYNWSKRDNRLTVMFAEDITATFMLFFSCCFLHGVRKENKNLIYIGSMMTTYFIISQFHFCLRTFINDTFSHVRFFEHAAIAAVSGLNMVIEYFFCVIILNYHKEVKEKQLRTYLQMAAEGENDEEKNNPHSSNQSLVN